MIRCGIVVHVQRQRAGPEQEPNWIQENRFSRPGIRAARGPSGIGLRWYFHGLGFLMIALLLLYASRMPFGAAPAA